MHAIDLSHNELLQPLAIIVTPIAFYAELIEQQFEHLLRPPIEGIYRVGDITPILYANKRYFIQRKVNNSIVLEPITDFSKVEESIVDDSGNLILSAHYMKNKQMYLSNKPSIPTRGLEITKCLVDEHFANISPWAKSQGLKQRLYSFFKDRETGIQVVDEGFLERVCESLMIKINDFIGNDVWNIYTTKIIAVDMLIEKSIDYRIYDWTLQQQKPTNDYT